MRYRKEALAQPIVGLALSGGSTLGVAHIGVLKALQEAGIKIDCISGTSAGALVAASFAFGVPIEQIIETTKSLNWKKLSRFGYSKLGLNTNSPMGAFITDTLGDVRIEDAKIPLAIVATNIETHEMVVLRKGRLHDAIRASTCIPGMFTPVEIDGALLVDGALTENLPLTPLGSMGATVRIGVNLSAFPSAYRPKNMLEVLYASFTVLSRHRDQHISENADVLIEPDLRRFDSSKFKNIEELVQAGYDAAVKSMPLIREEIFPRQEERGILRSVKAFLKRT